VLADAESYIVCLVTAANAGGETRAQSAPLGPVAAPAGGGTGGGQGGGTGTGTGVTPGDDVSAPRAVVLSRRCRSLRCVIRVNVSDAEPSAGIRSLSGRLRWTERRSCVRDGRRTTCRRTRSRAVRISRIAGNSFQVRTPRVRPRRYTLRLVATDRAGNQQLVPTNFRFTLRRSSSRRPQPRPAAR
jgi:hypothetical protein